MREAERLNGERKKVNAALAEAAEHEPRLWLAEHGAALSPELSRAAREGRLVRNALYSSVEERVEDAVRAIDARLSRGDWAVLKETWATEERREVPSATAYELYDALMAGRDQIARSALLPHTVVTVGPISRFDVAPQGSAVWRTGVAVTVTHPWLAADIDLVMLCEPLDLDEDDNNDDSED
jgi:hypothetical protein